MSKSEMTDEAFGELYDSLGDKTDASVIMWDELAADTRRQIRATFDRAYNVGFDEGEAHARNPDLGARPWRTGSKNPQTVYDARDRQVASAQTGELAAFIVRAVNANPLEQAAFQNTFVLLRKSIEKVAESLENASGNPHISGADDRALKWAAEQVRGVLR